MTKFTATAAAFLALVGSAFAQEATEHFDAITYPTRDVILSAGSTYTIAWDSTDSYADQTVTILLLEGASQGTLNIGPTVACMFLPTSVSCCMAMD